MEIDLRGSPMHLPEGINISDQSIPQPIIIYLLINFIKKCLFEVIRMYVTLM